MKTMNLKYFGIKILIFRGHVTSSEHDHRTRREIFPIGSQWWPCVYLAQIRRYRASKILGSRVWFFGVTWRHRSRDHWTRHIWFPIGGSLEPSVYFAPLRRYSASNIMGSRVWPFGVTWRHRSRDHSTRHMWFLIGGLLKPCIYLAPLRRYKASNLHLPMLKAKSSVRMRRVTWPVGRGSKITTYSEFPSPHCLFTMQLLWGYDDD